MKLKDWRHEHGVSQTQVSVGTGIAHTLISKYEAGKVQPKVPNILLIQKFTDGAVTIDDWQRPGAATGVPTPRLTRDGADPPHVDDVPEVVRS